MSIAKQVIARFTEPPGIGTAISHDDQEFRLVLAEPYTRKDGERSAVLTWASECLDCGGAFTFNSGLAVFVKRRRCDQHKWRNLGARS